MVTINLFGTPFAAQRWVAGTGERLRVISLPSGILRRRL